MKVLRCSTWACMMVVCLLTAAAACGREPQPASKASPASTAADEPQTPHPLDMPHRCTENQKPYQ